VPEPEVYIPMMSPQENNQSPCETSTGMVKSILKKGDMYTSESDTNRFEVLILNRDKTDQPLIFQGVTKDRVKLVEDLHRLFDSHNSSNNNKYIRMGNLELSIANS
jgi:hypothetical protein